MNAVRDRVERFACDGVLRRLDDDEDRDLGEQPGTTPWPAS
jgi:hypothetical protein